MARPIFLLMIAQNYNTLNPDINRYGYLYWTKYVQLLIAESFETRPFLVPEVSAM